MQKVEEPRTDKEKQLMEGEVRRNLTSFAREWRCFLLTAACAQWFGCGPSYEPQPVSSVSPVICHVVQRFLSLT